MSAPSCLPRLVSAMSSAWAAATASSKNNSKKSPIRKNKRQPGFARLILWYWTMTGEAGGSVIGGRGGMADACGCLTVACPSPEQEREDRHDRGCEIFSGHSRGGRLVSRPGTFP